MWHESKLGYPISLLTPKTALSPGSYRVNPDLPRPLKLQGPASGSPGRDLGSGSNELKTALSF